MFSDEIDTKIVYENSQFLKTLEAIIENQYGIEPDEIGIVQVAIEYHVIKEDFQGVGE